MARTEEQKVAMSPISVTLGEKKYEIKPLTILKSRDWRTKLNQEMAPIAATFQATNGSVVNGLAEALLRFPEKVATLLFEYAPDLPQSEILENATEEQLSTAFSEVMVVAYPYLAPLMTTVKLIRPNSQL